jgi:hypothetical protein
MKDCPNRTGLGVRTAIDIGVGWSVKRENRTDLRRLTGHEKYEPNERIGTVSTDIPVQTYSNRTSDFELGA